MKNDKNESVVLETTIEESSTLTAAGIVCKIFAAFKSLVNKLAPSFTKVNNSGNLLGERFIATCIALSNVDRFGTTVTIGSVVYPLSDYKIDSRLKALIQPRAIQMPGPSFYWKDMRSHGLVESTLLTPSEFIAEQYSILNKFKNQPQFTDVINLLEPISVSDVATIIDSSLMVHVEDLALMKDLPILLTINDLAWESAHFQVPLEEALRPLAVNMLSDLATKGHN